MAKKLLNINDIREKNFSKDIPNEITETRNLITDSFKDLEFVEETHKYFIPNGKKKEELPSVSSVIKQWEQEVDWDEKAEIKSVKMGITAEELKKQWHENNILSTCCGSKTHFFGENAMNMIIGKEDLTKKNMPFQYTSDGYLIPYCQKEWAITQYYQDIINNPNVFPVMPEAKIYMKNSGDINVKKPYAGTLDILLGYRYKGDIVYSLQDFKGFPLDTPILTIDGFKTMGDIKVGDIVYDKDGKQTKVINCSEIHYDKPCLRICFDDNYSIVSDFEHRWLVSFSKNGKMKDTVMTTQELYDYTKEIHKYNKIYPFKIPKICISKPIYNTETAKLQIDPYVFGVWLGDGHSSTSYVTNSYHEIFNEIERRGYKVGENVDKNRHCGKAKTRYIYGLYGELRKLNLLRNKHIPDSFIVKSSYKQRLDILRGLMDTDGYYNKKRNRYSISTTKYNQVLFSVKILTSLGIKPTVIKAKGSCNNCPNKKKFEKWDVCFSTDVYPFLIRKINTKNVGDKRHTWRNIIKIEKVETVPTRCIEVDSPSHTYLIDTMMLVTHNTNKELYKEYSRTFDIMMKEPFGSMGFYEEPFYHYVIQLNCYQLGLMQIGIKIIDRTIVWLKDDGTYEKVKVPDITNKLLEIL